MCMISCVPLSAASCAVTLQTPLSMEFSRQEYWSGLPFPPPGDLPDPGTGPMSPVSPALAGGLFTPEPPGKPDSDIMVCYEGSSGFGSIPRWAICSSSSVLPPLAPSWFTVGAQLAPLLLKNV